MIITPDNYRSFPAVANSDLSWLEKLDQQRQIDCEQAFKMGSLIDAMITEPHRVDFYTYRLEGVQYTKADFDLCKKMKKSFDAHPYCQDMVKDCFFQHISYHPEFEITFEGLTFALPAKAKWDLKKKLFRFGGDIKSTTAETWRQCYDAVDYFNYDRSRAWYMDLEGHTNDMLIFISKKNFQIFLIPVSSIDHGKNATEQQKQAFELYRRGKEKYQKLAFEYAIKFTGLRVKAA